MTQIPEYGTNVNSPFRKGRGGEAGVGLIPWC